MKTEYKYIYFELIEELPKTQVWWCRNNRSKSILSTIKWYSPWRQYCSFEEGSCVFNSSCHRDIAAFLEQLNAGQKEKSRKAKEKSDD